MILAPKLTFKSAAPLDAETLELLRTHKTELLRGLTAADALPRLPWQLVRLVRAASSNLLSHDPLMLPSGLVPGMNRYTLAWAASYLTGDKDEALRRLWAVYREWQGVN